jgi:hypothetical protein
MSNELFFTNLWFLANPNPAHGMGESDSKTPYSLEPGSSQSNLMALKPTPSMVHCRVQADYGKSFSLLKRT